MKDKKMISIDQFTADERLAVDEMVRERVQKYQLRTGKAPDSKKEKELIAEARETVMAEKLAKEKAKAAKKPVRKKKPSALTASEVSDFNWSASVERGKR
ncbi:hypothetical protein CYR40_07790 [Chimaeribacter arupi]|jgi:hypothetical protein|uniref:DUF3811 domain-containing protein n=2 Tax=Yersiniaceae TaxID=1903411 RepID=A0A2N5ENB1_9GAMM|nr:MULTISPECIES: hypothetical protein [Yersiniaceae]MBS0969402.1 hypothetical protein [Nissabacter archeti]MDV5140185.1 hypothetical protein [Chimaeribacter arupi]PLR31382.1 hypothetical protein CYR23_16035 [Chimaeribacter arupi]PLR47498.1 hypothetical protein CYR40_07790 [Chimaeribacter arupi]PLR50167.1 hypothetical protein CYR34_09705 [Chimaeribacter arupi]